MDSAQTLCIVGGLACALASAFIFGRSAPSWEDDAGNDYLPGELSVNAASYGWGGRGDFDMRLLDGCLSPLLRIGNLGATLLGLAALVMIYGFSGLGSSEGLHEEGGDILLLFDVRFWILLGAAGVGYVMAVVTDKGPVGPLQ